jgi:hypothetical protein
VDERFVHYLRDYWRDLIPQAREDVKHFYGHLGWDIVKLLVVLMLAPTLAALLDLRAGLLVGGGTLALVFIFHLFVLSAARLHRNSRSEIEGLRTEKMARLSELASQPNLFTDVTIIQDQISLLMSNSGETADKLYAHVVVLQGANRPHGTRYLQSAYGIPLLKGPGIEIPIASCRVRQSGQCYKWDFYLQDAERQKGTWHVDFSERTIVPVAMRISILCEPHNQGGLIEWQITSQGRQFRTEQTTPPPAPPPAAPPSPTASV